LYDARSVPIDCTTKQKICARDETLATAPERAR